jgi:uncharacterized protein
MLRRLIHSCLILAALLIAGTPVVAWAGPLDGPKAAGLIGERPDGFLGLVTENAPADVKALVDKTNAERRVEYEKLAAQVGTSVDAVEVRAGKQLIAKQPPGYYVMNADGSWVRK